MIQAPLSVLATSIPSPCGDCIRKFAIDSLRVSSAFAGWQQDIMPSNWPPNTALSAPAIAAGIGNAGIGLGIEVHRESGPGQQRVADPGFTAHGEAEHLVGHDKGVCSAI